MSRSTFSLALAFATALVGSCNQQPEPADTAVKAAIQRQLDRCVQAVVTKDIDLYMELIPESFTIRDNDGAIISRQQQREYTLRDWAIIDTTLSNTFVVDSITNLNDSVIAYTSQRWKRLMFQRDGKTRDTILTTQTHAETWKQTPKGWLNFSVAELGGQVYINGKLLAQ